MSENNTPNIPVERAWANMKDLLDAELPANNKNNNNNRKRYSVLALLLLIGSCGVYQFGIKQHGTDSANALTANSKTSVEHHSTDKQIKPSTENTVVQQSKTETNNDKQSKASRQETIASNHTTKVAANTDGLITPKKESLHANKNKLFANNLSIQNSFSHTTINNKKQNNNTITSIHPNANSSTKHEINTTNTITVTEKSNEEPVVASTINIEQNNKKAEPAKAEVTEVAVVKKDDLNNSSASNTNTPKKIINKTNNQWHYGLQWNALLPLSGGNAYLNMNGNSQPLSVLIPEVWVSKALSKKHELALLINPYSSYALNNNYLLNPLSYSGTIRSASLINSPANNTYQQGFTINKLMGVEATLFYFYHLNKQFTVGLGVGNNWLYNAVIQEQVIKNGSETKKGATYGITASDKEWQQIKSSYITGRIEVLYQLNKFQIGASAFKPLSNIYTSSSTGDNSVNTQLLLRWRIK